MSNSVFKPALLDSEGSTFKNNCPKKIIYIDPYSISEKCRLMTLVFGNINYL